MTHENGRLKFSQEWRRLLFLAVKWFFTFHLLSAQATALPWPESSFTYISDNQPITEVLRKFGQTFGLDLKLSETVLASRAVVNGKITTSNPTEFLNQIGSAYGLTWFVQNGTLYVSRSSERITKSLSPPGISAAGLKKALSELGVLDSKFGWGEVAERGLVLVSGPPAYVELVTRSVQELPAMMPELEIQIFRLRHAPVDDRTIFYRDRRIVTPGVATILRGLISGEGRYGTNVILSEMAAPLRPSSSLVPANDQEGEKNTKPAPVEDASTAVNPGAAAGRAVIQADPRLNAVVVKDRAANMRIYKQLIELLDVPSQLVEIEAMILDVNARQVSELGIDWSARVGRISGNIGSPGSTTSSPSSLISLGGGNAATIASDAANFLLTRIRALENKGQAKVISRPSILTMDNQGALIDLAETFYIQSVGERVANVTPVSVGVTLKVTPHIIEQHSGKSVQLVVDIEDGSRVDQLVNGFPAIRRSNIGTQAVIGEHDSLLIGGFNSESTIRDKESVPVLGDIPVVGSLFGTTKSTVERRQRLFLITPRIVASSISAQPLASVPASLNERTVAKLSQTSENPKDLAGANAVVAARRDADPNPNPNPNPQQERGLKIRMDAKINRAPSLPTENK